MIMRYLYPENTRLYLLSCDNLAVDRFFLKVALHLDVVAFVNPFYRENDNDDYTKAIYNRRVISFQHFLDEYDGSAKVVIFENNAEKRNVLLNILKKHNMRLFDNYMWWENVLEPSFFGYWFMKGIFGEEITSSLIKKMKGDRKTILVNGNCQTTPIKKYLLSSPAFRENFMLIDSFAICTFKGENVDELLNCVDYAITQPISTTNKFTPKLSTEYIREHMCNPDNLVVIPNLTFMGYYPQYGENISISFASPVIRYGDKEINALSKGKSFAEIYRIISNEDFYSREFLDKFFNDQVELFKIREESADIKMYDFIAENCRKEVLMHSYNHPKAVVIKEMVKRLLVFLFNKLGSTEMQPDFLDDELFTDAYTNTYISNQGQPIYPSVLKYLGLKNDMLFYPNQQSSEFRLNFKEYMEFYYNSIPAQDKFE